MKRELWIARDKPSMDVPQGCLCLYGNKPEKDEYTGVFCGSGNKALCDDFTFFECGDTTDMIILNPNTFPEITWENSPQLLTLNNLK